jgi:K+-transporting ATPase ATPase C chain
MRRQIYPSIMMTVLFTVLFGLIYPLAITGVAQVLFPKRANGSLIVDRGRVAGSRLIGQPFSDPKYFWGRLSATSPFPYNAASSSGSNLGPTNQALVDAVKQRIDDLRKADPGNTAPVPVDLVTASGSGLDPDISPAAAAYQAARVARARRLPPETVDRLIREHTAGRQFGILGEPRVNVLELNRALDQTR